MRRWLALLLAAMMLLGCAPAEMADVEEISLDEEESAEAPAEETAPAAADGADPVPAEPGAFPPLNEQGFLDEGEFVYIDEEAGVWRYASPTLRVEIYRRTQDKPKLVWYEAEIWAAEGEIFRMLPWSEGSRRWTNLNYPYKTARKHGCVFALSGDFAHLRLSKKQTAGILVRGGEIVNSRTNRANKQFPNLDTLALMPDGEMRVYTSNELKARDYVDMGALDVLAFGPYMIRDGELNTAALKKFATGSAPRTAIGMVEKGHYFAIVTEGRVDRSKGCSVRFCAERMLELGCTAAFNLDGGQSSAMVFMGHQVNLIVNGSGKRASARKAAEILGIGFSTRVAAPGDPF